MDIDIHTTDSAPFGEAFTGSFLDDDHADTDASENEIYNIRNFMCTLFYDIRLRILPDKKLLQSVLRRRGIYDDSEAVLVGNTVYTYRDMRDAFALIKEFMRPFIEMLQQRYAAYFHVWYCDAKADFPSINQQIADSEKYQTLSEDAKEEELVAQILARLFLKSLGKSKKRHNSFRHFIYKYVQFERNIQGFETLPTFKKTRIGTQLIPMTSLYNLRQLTSLADALNTCGISFSTRRNK